MGVTISTHNGSSVARDHNIRNRNITDKESHIDPNGVYEIWHDEKLTDAYHRLFDGAVERYNEKQRRADRRIENYLAAVQKDAAKKPVYEMIVGVYGADCTNDTKREILREFVDSWTERNPNLEMIGAYYHADEESQDPHVHIDYIPVAHGYRRGMDTQNGLVKALQEQGIKSGETTKDTAQIKWEKRENEYLERLCVARGLTVERPGKGRKHLDTQEYKELMEDMQSAREEYVRLTEQLAPLREQAAAIDRIEAAATPIPLTKKVALDAADYNYIKAQAQSYITQEEKLQARSDELDRRESDMTAQFAKREKELDSEKSLLAGREARTRADWANLEKAEGQLQKDRAVFEQQKGDFATRLTAVEERERAVAELDAKNQNVHKALKISEDRVLELTNENGSLVRQMAAQSLKASEAAAEHSTRERELRDALRAAYDRMAEIVKAVVMLKYDKSEGYKVDQLSKKQQSLIDGIADYGAAMADKAGYPDQAEVMRKKLGIVDKVKEFVQQRYKELTKKDLGDR